MKKSYDFLKWFKGWFTIKHTNILLITTFFAMFVFGKDPLILIALLIWVNMMFYCLKSFSDRVGLFAFLIAFFVFLMGRQVLVDLFEYKADPVFSIDIEYHAKLLIIVALLSLSAGYVYFERNNNVKIENRYENEEYIAIVKKVSKFIFYGSFVFLLLMTIEKVWFVTTNSYLEYYTSYTSSFPYVLKKIGDMSPISFFVFLAAFPSKKEIRTPLLFFVMYLIITLGTGQRFTFVANLLIIFVYFFIRNKIDKKIKWISKKQIIIIIVAVPILLILLNFVNYIRFSIHTDNFNFIKEFFNFFYKMGSSVNVIKYEALLKDSFPDKLYSFGSTFSFFQENLISRIFGIASYSGNTVEHALYGYSFEHTISYLGWGNYYLAGNGMGSSYIAESFHDFAIYGVVLINIIYAYLLNTFFKLKSKHIFINAVYLISFSSFLLAPRGSCDEFVRSLVDFTTWATIIVIYVTSNILYKKKFLFWKVEKHEK